MGERASRTRRGRRVAAGSIVAALCLSLPGVLGARGVGAQTGGFRNGEAEASADTFSLNIRTSNANIGFTYGRTLVNYRDTTGTAEARALDLGILPTLFGVEQCDGSPPTLNVATIPQAARVDSTEPRSDRSRRTEARVPGLGDKPAGPIAGWQDATATRLPSARGVTESVDTDVFLLALKGGRTEATTKLENGVREAVAVSTAEELRVFGGLFTFRKPRWEAVARSGATTTTTGSFTFERATVLGVPRSPEQAMREFREFKRGLEDLLRPLGVSLRWPEVVVDGGRVKVTPMEFRVDDPPWGAQVIAPFLGNIQPLREVLTRQLIEEDCKNASTILLLDVILGILAGNGAVEISAGGVDVFTADTDFSSAPPIDLPVDRTTPPPPAPAPPPVEVAPIVETPIDLGLGFDDLGFESFDTTFDQGFEELPVEEFAAAPTTTAGTSGDTEEVAAVAASSGPAFEPSGAGAAAVAVGIVGLLGALALSFGDRLLARRSTRRIP
jgi:hypothetical protein